MNLLKQFSFIKKILRRSVKLLLLIAISAIISTGQTEAQEKSSISGKVVDDETGEPLIGVNILIEGTMVGTSADLEGFYAIKNIDPGVYSIRFSYVGYSSTIVKEVELRQGSDKILNIALKSSTAQLNEVVVTADAIKGTENSILKIQKNANIIMDALSLELIKKNNSSDGVDVLKRMTGVSIFQGKYAIIRGVSDRYNAAMLNGANLPSSDPEKRSFSYDIIPSSIIESVITAKTSSPDKPADFSGGLVQINTVEFPSKFFIDFSYSNSYMNGSSNEKYLGYNGGGKDYLGYDDGTRKMPEIIGKERVTRGFYSSQELRQIGLSFKNNLQPFEKQTSLNKGFKLSIGDKYLFNESTLGIVGALTYSNNDELRDFEKNNFTDEGARYQYKGTNFSNTVLWSALLNTSFKLGKNHKISLKNMYNQTADDDIDITEGDYNYIPEKRRSILYRYVSRSLASSQIIGEHSMFLLNGALINWNFNYSDSKRNEPDARRNVFSRGDDSEPWYYILDQSLSTRFFSELNDKNYGGASDFTIKPFSDGKISFKVGGLLEKKERSFNARIFGFKNNTGGGRAQMIYEDSVLKSGRLDYIFDQKNFNQYFIEVVEITKPSDSYAALQEARSAFIMMETPILSNIRIVGGIRYEYSRQLLNSIDIKGDNTNVDNSYNDLLPSMNIIYQMNETINFRAAYSKTLARPEFREIAPYAYFDFLSNELVIGNPELIRTMIDNYDLRLEFYPDLGEIAAVSLFYKKFNNPIEQILIASSSFEPIRSYGNANNAVNYGVEFELRKNLEFVYSGFSDLSFVGNVSLIKSEIDLGESVNTEFVRAKRPLQGQSDYILNLGLYYDNYEYGVSSGLTYNKIGYRIAKVGYGNLGDIIEKPRDQVDFNISKRIIENISLSLSAKDILAQDIKYLQRTNNGDKIAESYRRSASFSMGLSLKL